MVLTVNFRFRQSVPDIDYVIFLSLHPLTVKSLFGCIIPFFTAILKRIKAWILSIVCIYGGIFKLSVCCVTFQKKGKSHLQREIAIISEVVPMASLTSSNGSSLKFP